MKKPARAAALAAVGNVSIAGAAGVFFRWETRWDLQSKTALKGWTSLDFLH